MRKGPSSDPKPFDFAQGDNGTLGAPKGLPVHRFRSVKGISIPVRGSLDTLKGRA